MEERAERRLEIFKNLTDRMATAGPSPDPAAVVTEPPPELVTVTNSKKRVSD